MKITSIKISNIMGIEHLEFEPGSFTVASGHNGSDKTSLLESIKAAFGGGHDATLLRSGEEKGEIVLVLDDGTEIIKQVKTDSSQTKVKQGGKPIAKPADFIKRLTDAVGVNPVAFLKAASKDRVRLLLEAMPIEADTVYLSEISGLKVDASLSGLGLSAIDHVRRQVFDSRTGTNRAIKEKQATVNQLEATLPEGGPGDHDTSGMLDQITAIDAARHTEERRISDKLDSLRNERDAAIEELNRQIQEAKENFAESERLANARREKVLEKHAADRLVVSNQLAAIEEQQKAVARYQQTQDTIKLMIGEVTQLEKQAADETQALTDIDQYKADMLAKLPIPGIEVIDGEIYRGGVHFDKLNTQQQVEIAVEVAKLRSGEIGVICVDGLELLDTKHFEAFREAALESGLQFFVTRVSDDDFSIETTDEE